MGSLIRGSKVLFSENQSHKSCNPPLTKTHHIRKFIFIAEPVLLWDNSSCYVLLSRNWILHTVLVSLEQFHTQKQSFK